MAEHKSAEQVRDECMTIMGSELGELYYDLWSDVAWLHDKWHQYRELFGVGPERVDLLNRVAPLFFGLAQTTLFDDILLNLARLTDPPQSLGRANLTVQRIPALITDPALKAEVVVLLQATLDCCSFARDWRNRRLAHTDLLTSREQHPVPLAPASRHAVEVALAAMRNLLNRLESYFRQSEVGYDIVIEQGGAEELIYYLELGIKAADE